MAEAPDGSGLLDTSVVIALGEFSLEWLPAQTAISTLTLAELTVGPHAVSGDLERAKRQRRLQLVESGIEALTFDSDCARAYGAVYVAATATDRKPRGARAIDLMIAATALAHSLPLFTINARDFLGLDHLVEIVDVGAAGQP